jgi:hypothetical protein
MKRLAVLMLSSALLCGCATDGSPPVGASVQPIEAGRFHVTYRGTSRMSPPEVQDRALLQAAQLTLAQGYDWFQVISRSGGPAAPTTPRFSIGIGGADFGRGGGVGVGGAESFGGQPTFVATLEILLGHGQPPTQPQAYDARSVSSTLGPRFAAPQ